MKIHFRKICYLLLVLSYWTPFIAKLDHHHTFVPCKDAGKLHFHDRHEKCQTCSFDFSACSNPPETQVLSKTEFPDAVSSPFFQHYLSDNKPFSFLLRGPPLSANSI